MTLTVTALVLSLVSLTGQALDSVLVGEVESRIETLLDSAPVPGLAVGIVRGNDIIYENGFGIADRATGQPVTPETLFQIGSTTKSFTATLLAILVDRGRVAVDDPIAKYLPPDVPVPVSEDGTPITIRHLVTHTSGLPRQPPTLRRLHGDYPVLAFTHFELYQSIEASELAFPVGSRFQYSNFGFGVLGHVLERATGLPYETLLAQEIFAPLGMTGSTVTVWPRHRKRLAAPYYPNTQTGELEDYTPWDMEALSPAGGITSSVQDLAKYVSLQLRNSHDERGPIPRSALQMLRSPQWEFSESQSYGMGWFIGELDGVGETIAHGGEVDGYTSYLAFSPQPSVGVIILANAGDAPLNELGNWILRKVVTDG